ncbi:MAG TPA: hypothetical protein VJQ55_03145 [Candidatus Binatia bacterium]|nr:hypothetical protein [Candidatus Binatia bacterium]
MKSDKLRFLRTEFFESDFKAILGKFLDISRIPDQEFKKKVNVSKRVLPEGLKQRLYGEPNKVYESCPYWRSLEEIAYGKLELPCDNTNQFQS